MQKKLDCAEENSFWRKGFPIVIGADEAGRGCLAGPVCAAVTAFPDQNSESSVALPAAHDSKKLSEEKRELFFQAIQSACLAHGIGYASAVEVDRWNIVAATSLAIARAMEQLLAQLIAGGNFSFNAKSPLFPILVDGSLALFTRAEKTVFHKDYEKEFPFLKELFTRKWFKEICFVKGDGRVYSIASASILAKVSRDRKMRELDSLFPQYQFSAHKGYGTELHVAKLREHGPCSEHRRSFAPVTQISLQF